MNNIIEQLYSFLLDDTFWTYLLLLFFVWFNKIIIKKLIADNTYSTAFIYGFCFACPGALLIFLEIRDFYIESNSFIAMISVTILCNIFTAYYTYKHKRENENINELFQKIEEGKFLITKSLENSLNKETTSNSHEKKLLKEIIDSLNNLTSEDFKKINK